MLIMGGAFGLGKAGATPQLPLECSVVRIFVRIFVVNFVANFVGSSKRSRIDKVYDKVYDKVSFAKARPCSGAL
jgi:putative exporter of polyketide antibiotics